MLSQDCLVIFRKGLITKDAKRRERDVKEESKIQNSFVFGLLNSLNQEDNSPVIKCVA